MAGRLPKDSTTAVANGEMPVAQYLRMSTEHQRYSPENQQAAILEYASAHGMRIVRTYRDDGKSGLNIRGRLGLQQLLNDVQVPGPGFQAVLVLDVTRWGRFPDPDEAAEYARICKRNGVRVIYCAEPFENDGSITASVMVGLKRGMAAEYSRELSVKVFAGHRNLVQLGFRQGGQPGLGLRRQLVDEQLNAKGILQRGEKKSIQTDRVLLVPGPQEEIATVHEIYDLFLDASMPERVIAFHLNRKGISTDRGTEWTRATVHQVLTNEKYIGNNVYNRRSFKLKIHSQLNPPSQWIRKNGAFQAIVPVAKFLRVQEIIAARSAHLDDDQMLGLLRKVLDKYGALSGMVIDEEDGLPSSSTYSSRFGSLLKAYSLVGYTPRRDYAYIEINRALRRHHPELVDEVIAGIQDSGGWVVKDADTDLLTVNSEFTTSVVIARCKQLPSGSNRWVIRLDTSLEPDITVVARMAPSNNSVTDYYILPAIDFTSESLPFREDNDFTLDAYRVETLEGFYDMTGRVTLLEAA